MPSALWPRHCPFSMGGASGAEIVIPTDVLAWGGFGIVAGEPLLCRIKINLTDRKLEARHKIL